MKRLLVVFRHFWPICGESAYRAAEFSTWLGSSGIDVTVLTPRWNSRWPASFMFREQLVHRILPPPISAWNESFFQRNLWQWIERHAGEFDAIYLDTPALAPQSKVLSKLDRLKLLVNLNQQTNPLGLDTKLADLHYSRTLSAQQTGIEVLARNPNAYFVVPTAANHRLAIANGIDESRIFREPWAALEWFDYSKQSREKAKTILQHSSSDFAVPPELPLVVVFFESHATEEEHQFLSRLAELQADRTRFRGWVFGSGDCVRRHYAMLRDQGCHHEILLHSSFDNLESVYQAADLVIRPAATHGRHFYLPTAFATGTPTLMTQSITDAIDTASDSAVAQLFDSVNPEINEQVARLESFLESPDRAKVIAERLRSSVNWKLRRKQYIDFWLNLLSTC